jgi:uridine phosphorylase
VSFPNYADKHAHDAIISPEHVVAATRANPAIVVPDAAVLIYQRSLLEHLDVLDARLVTGYPGNWRTLRVVERLGSVIGIVGPFGIGAPAAAAVLEELIALGVRRFINMGAAGSLQADSAFGDMVVCQAAIRDEGVSHHYLASEKFAYPSTSLTAELHDTIVARAHSPRPGVTWTIDAPYRETLAEARSYRDEGVLTVEMEAAALFAVAEYRGVDVACALAVSDHLLQQDRWMPGFGTEELRFALVELLEASIDTLAAESRVGI